MKFTDDGSMINLLPTHEFKPIDDVLVDVFARHNMGRLGGASGRGWSSYATFQRCPYLYKVKYIDRERGTPALALETGSAFHTFMALHYTWMLDENLTLTPEVCREELLDNGARPEGVLAGWQCYDNYRLHYEQDYIYPLGIEEFAEGDHGNTCRYDLIARVDKPQPGIIPGTYIVEHKCLAADEQLQDQATGRLYTIADLHARGIAPVVLGVDEHGKLVRAQAEVPQPTSLRDVYEVVLASGRRLRTSDNHPFLTDQGWVAASALTQDHWVALPTSTGGLDHPSAFTDAEVEFVGMMLGDGTLTGNKFSKSAGPVLDRFYAVLHTLGYHAGGGTATSYRVDESDDRVPTVAISAAADSPTRRLLETLGLWGHLAADEFIPNALFALPDAQIFKLLAGLWNTDGCVDTFVEHYKNRVTPPQTKVRIAYVSRSRKLAEGVQTLLHRLGLPSTVTESSVEYEGARRDVWTTKVITRRGKRRFLTLVREGQLGFVKYPVDDAFEAIKHGDDTAIPTALIKRVVPDADITGQLRQQLHARSIEHATLAKHGDKKQRPAIAQLLAQELTWDRVSHVLVSGRSVMYDLTVPGVHNFVANGIVTHNTSARFTMDLLQGWHNDGEILGQIMVWKQAKLDKKYGKLRGTIVNIVGKQKKPQFERVIVPAQAWHVREHTQDLQLWNLYQQLCRTTNSWPKARNNCISKFGMCDLFTHCSTNDKLTPLRRIEKAMKAAADAAKSRDALTSSQEALALFTDVGNMADTNEPSSTDSAPIATDIPVTEGES